MKHDEYLRKINSNEEVEPGLLSELEVDLPPGMHDKIMDSIKIENKRRLRFAKYKIFVPAAAAAIVIAVSIGSMSGLLNNNNETKSKFTAKNSTSNQSNEMPSVNKNTVGKSNKPAGTDAVAANSQVQNKTNTENTKKDTTKKVASSTPKKTAPKKTTKYQNTIDENTVADEGSIGNVEIIDGSSDSYVASASVADYELVIYKDEVDILSFINQKCEFVDKYNNFYKIRTEDFKVLNDMISKKTDSCKLIETKKDSSSRNSNYLLIKLIVK